MVKKIIFKITYPNRKIYIGSDLCNDIKSFGSPHDDDIAKDFTEKERESFTITRDIPFSSYSFSKREIIKKEMPYVREYQSKNPKIAYNRQPKYKEL